MDLKNSRAEKTALVGLVLQALVFVVVLVLAMQTTSPALLASAMFVVTGLGIWMCALVERVQMRLAWTQRQEVEALERERHERLGGSDSVFAGYNAAEELPMERRLKFVQRWLTPGLALVNALIMLWLAYRLLPWGSPMTMMNDFLERGLKGSGLILPMVVLFGIFLICFVTSRYALGVSRVRGSRVVRAGSNALMGNAIVAFASAVALGLAYYDMPMAERVVAKAIGILIAVVGLETILNLVLDIYRPRVPGEEAKPPYESRLLGLFSEPEGVVRSIAHTVDYQFGFKVSETWFYQLLQQAVAPLVLVGGVIIYALSCIVVIEPGQQGVLMHWGKVKSVLPEGVALKYPWPVETCKIVWVDTVRTLTIGYEANMGLWDSKDPRRQAEPILWTKPHVEGDKKNEFQMLVAMKESATSQPVVVEELIGRAKRDQTRLKPVNILAAAAFVTWKVKPTQDGVLEYVSGYESPEQSLAAIAYRVWTQYMASVDPMQVMTVGRDGATKALHAAIQKEIDANKLGIEVLRVGLIGMHPYLDVADAYEAAINARQEKESLVWRAQGEANVKVPLARASASEVTGQAKANRYGKVSIEKAKSERFAAQQKGYDASPEVFVFRQYMDTLTESTKDVRKYVLALDRPERVMLIVNEEEKLPAGMLDLGQEINESLKGQQ